MLIILAANMRADLFRDIWQYLSSLGRVFWKQCPPSPPPPSRRGNGGGRGGGIFKKLFWRMFSLTQVYTSSRSSPAKIYKYKEEDIVLLKLNVLNQIQVIILVMIRVDMGL